MSVIASFNYALSDAAVVTGWIVALGIAAGAIWYCRPLMAAAVGALSWATIGYVVGLCGTGDMTNMMATIYAILGLPIGGAVAGIGAAIRYYWNRSRAGHQDASSQ